jgi:hypothetical protein
MTSYCYAQNADSLRTSLLGKWTIWGIGRISQDSLVCGEKCKNWSITFNADSTFSSMVFISDDGRQTTQTGKYRISEGTKTVYFYEISVTINDVMSKLNSYERAIKRIDSNTLVFDKCLLGPTNIEDSEIKSCTPKYKKS